MKLNKIDEVWNSANRLLRDFFVLLSSKNFATMETWRNDFSFLLVLGKKLKFISSMYWLCGVKWMYEPCRMEKHIDVIQVIVSIAPFAPYY